MTSEDPEKITEALEALANSDDRDELEAAAVLVASSGDFEAIRKLGILLGHASFLARLDDTADPADKTFHLGRVFGAIAQHPSAQIGELAVRLAADPEFMADDDRRIYLLPALAAVRPMTSEGAAIFRKANAEGYFATDAPLLVANGSPLALALFEEMIRDASVPPERRVDSVHTAVLPRRTDLEVLRSAARLLAGPLEDEVAFGLLETLFDHQSKRWFGPALQPPEPPPWESASTEALELLVRLGEDARARSLPPELAAAVDLTLTSVRRILEDRRNASDPA